MDETEGARMQSQTEQALTLARSCDLHLPVSLKMYIPLSRTRSVGLIHRRWRSARLEGSRPKKTFDELLEDPAARLAGYQQECALE